MSATQEIMNFLARKDNLPVALEIANYVEDLKRQTHHDFWSALNNELTRRVETEFPGQWVFGKFNLRRLRRDWETSFIKMVIPPKEPAPQLLTFGVGQDSPEKNYRLYCSVFKPPNLKPIITTLRGLLVSVDLANTSNYWIGWGHLPITPFTVDFMSGMQSNKEGFVHESAQIIWDKFTLLRPEMEAINHQILQEQA